MMRAKKRGLRLVKGKNKAKNGGKRFKKSKCGGSFSKLRYRMLPAVSLAATGKAEQKEVKPNPEKIFKQKQRKSKDPSPQALREILAECKINLSEKQANLLWQFYLRLKEKNKEINLTRIHRFEDIVIKHFVDCALPGVLMALPSPLLDIGTGGGFPGVPLKIMYPEGEIILAEGRRLRVEFLTELQESLRLPGLSIHGRQIHSGFEQPVNGVITRAVEKIGPTLERISGCLVKGGKAIFMKGPSVDPELREAKTKLAGSYRLLEDYHYLLPIIEHKRRLVVFERL